MSETESLIIEGIGSTEVADIGDTLTLTSKANKKYNCKITDIHCYGYKDFTVKYGWEFNQNALGYFADLINYRVINKSAPYILVTGNERVGKSTLTLQLCRMINESFSIENICFTIEELNEQIRKGTKGTVIDFDETGVDLFNQNWQNKMQKNLYQKSQIIGILGEIVFLTLPHKNDLNLKFRDRRVDYWIDVYGKDDDTERGFVEIRKAIKSKWELDIYWEPLISFRFNELTGEFWNEYTEKKLAYIYSKNKEEEPIPAKENKIDLRNKIGRNRLIYELIEEIPRKYGKKLYTLNSVGEILNIDASRVKKIIDEECERMGKEKNKFIPSEIKEFNSNETDN